MSTVCVTIMGRIEVPLKDVSQGKSFEYQEEIVEDNRDRMRTAVEMNLQEFLEKSDWTFEEPTI